MEKQDESVKTYGYINGGGPAPGAKAVLAGIATVVKRGGHRLLAIPRGAEGMLTRQPSQEIIDVTALPYEQIQQLIHEAGMPVETSRERIKPTPQNIERVLDMAKQYGINGLIINGGDDTMATARELSEAGFLVVGVAKTIDNDIAVDDWQGGDTLLHQTYGWETACNTAMNRLLLLRGQARSTGRVAIGEVMGRKSGHMTLIAGKAAGADITLIRECPIESARLFQRVKELLEQQGHALIAIAEGYIHEGEDAEDRKKADTFGHGHLGGICNIVGDAIEEGVTYIRSDGKEKHPKVTRQIIGYDQQMESPTVMDDIRAYRMGTHAGYLAVTGQFGRMATMRGDFTTDVELSRVHGGQGVPSELYDPETMSMQDVPWHIEDGRLKVRELIRKTGI